ncbi:hypothetical protein [Deinococcus navajonensis]|uniref:Uncharacterized protein n=1 Tax=Deinococcus navajonensis TaxID=309884 RepID=A0ABV8XKJ1_9DEIO
MQSLVKRARLPLLALALLGGAQATGVEFSIAAHPPLGGPWSTGTVRFGVADVQALGGTVALGLSTRAAELRYSRGLALPPLGAVTARTELAVTWQGGLRAQTRVNGTLGPVAVNAGGAVFTAAEARIDPLSPYALTASDLRERGWNADLTVRYRLDRSLVALAGGELGPQPQVFLGVEGRRELSQVLPAAGNEEVASSPPGEETPGAEPGDPNSGPSTEDPGPLDSAPETEPDSPPDTEVTGTLTWRLGARAGQQVLGVTAGLGYATPAGLTLGLDALVGPGTFGVTASLAAADVLGEGSSLRLYGAYEPWRPVSLPWRAGLEFSVVAGPGQLGLDLRGGRSADGFVGYGARVSYRLPLADPAR